MDYEQPTHLDLFSGIGGFSLGAEAAGFKTIAFSEIDPYASAVLRKHWPDVPNLGDITKFAQWPELGAIDLLTGGFPCQPFSIAGRRKGEADNRNLWPAMLDVIKRYRPAWICGENVVNAANMVLSRCLDDLALCGYQSKAFDISACAVGLQTMERHIWIIATAACFRLARNSKESVSRKPIQVLLRRENDASVTRFGGIRSLPPSRLLRSRKGVPAFMDRIKCVGNAIPPHVSAPILEAIYQEIVKP